MILFRLLRSRLASLALLAMAFSGCSDEVDDPTGEVSINREDLNRASLKIVSGQAAEAVVLLEKLNRQFPENIDVLELMGLAHSEIGGYVEAAFWYEQVARLHPNGTPFLKLAGECYELSGQDPSAILIYSEYVDSQPDDGLVWHKLYQLMARAARTPGLPETELKQLATDAINAINMAKMAITSQEALEIARLLLKINILPVAESYFKEVANNPEGDQQAALTGLLEVYLAQENNDKAESTARLLEQRFAGSIDNDPLASKVIQLLASRHASTFFALNYEFAGRGVSDLLTTLHEHEVASISQPTGKLSLGIEPLDDPGADTNETEEPISLAELFGLGTEQSTEASPEANATEPMEKTADFIERAELALLDKNYRGAQLFLREAIKENPDDATAWFLRSRTHMLANEIEESEMTATEAVRLAPDDLEIRLHYLEAARPVLSPRRFLGELDEAHEQFPRSLDVLWQLAQQYHIVETNRNAAAILYRRFLEMAPAGHPMRARVQSELTMLNSP